MALTLDDFFQITIRLLVSAARPRELGRTLFVTPDTTLSGAGADRIMTFGSADEVDGVFPSGSTPREAAAIYFGQTPRPRPMQVARWRDTAVATTLTGGTAPVLAGLQAVSAGSFVAGGVAFTAIDLSTAADLAAVAMVVQTALRASTDARFSNAAFTFSGGRFLLSLPGGGDISGPFTDHTAGTALATLLGMSATANPTYRQGGVAETLEDALSAIRAIDDTATIIVGDPVIDGTADMVTLAEWANARPELVGCITNTDAASLVTNEAASQLALAYGAMYQVVATHTKQSDTFISMGVAALLSNMNLTLPESLLTLNLAPITGIVPDDYDLDERTELRRKNTNYYAWHDGVAAYAGGRTLAPGLFADTKYWMIWLYDRLRTSLLQHYQSTRAVRLTDAGMARQQEVAERVMAEGVVNGGLSPGFASPGLRQRIAQTIGKPAFDGYLENGYLGYTAPVSTQNQVDRDNRISLPLSLFGKLSGSSHSLAVGVTLEN